MLTVATTGPRRGDSGTLLHMHCAGYLTSHTIPSVVQNNSERVSAGNLCCLVLYALRIRHLKY